MNKLIVSLARNLPSFTGFGLSFPPECLGKIDMDMISCQPNCNPEDIRSRSTIIVNLILHNPLATVAL